MALCGFLKADTTATLSLGPFLDDDDALTEKTGLTIADTTVFLSKNGGAKANPNDTNDCTEDANGVYRKQINTTDTNTEGILTVYVHETDALYVRQDYMVVNANIYDSFFAAATTDYLQVDLLQMGGAAQSATDLKDFADAGYDPSTDKVTGVKLTDTCTTNTDMVGTNSAALASNYTAARAGYLDELASANIPADVDTLKTYCDILDNATNGLANLKTLIDAIKAITDDMQHTSTTIASVTTADTVFTLTDALTANDDVNNAVCSIYDSTGSAWSGPRKIEDYVHVSKTITIDENTPFALQAGDLVIIWNCSYATTAASAAISTADKNDIVDRVFDETMSDHLTEGTTGAKLNRADRVGR